MKSITIKIAALLLFSLISITTMNAQATTAAGQPLNAHQRSMARIAALTTIGNIDQLRPELAKGLEAGMTVNEVKEALVQLYAYCGFPRSLNALNALMAVVEERRAKGINDIAGRDASPVPVAGSKYETGKQTLQN
jgi:4-carboxymuconolactone decarboxylase